MATRHGVLLLATALAGLSAQPVRAQDASQRIDAIQAQINQLQQELRRMRGELAARDGQVRAAQADAARARAAERTARAQPTPSPAQTAQSQTPPGYGAPPPAVLPVQAASAATPAAPDHASGTFKLGGVSVTLGGFLAAEGVYRTRNDIADIGSNFNTIPFGQSPNYHTGEFRGTARQSRISLLAEGQVSDVEKISGYYESDFLGVGTTSNSTESNSYVPRLRQAYLTYDNSAWGVHALAGQAWSLLTMNRIGIAPRQEDVPLTIDAQYVPGFTWKRQWQLRVDKDLLDQRLWLAASFEEPQTSYYTGPNGLGVSPGTATISNAGGSQLNATTTYSDDIAPDLVVKAAFDPGWGHYEAYGVGRVFHDRVSFNNGGENNTTVAGGAGGGVILPIVPKMLDFEARGLAGYGIGSYGSGQLPDAIVSPSGSPKALPEYQVLVGLVGHPSPAVDLYGYAGTEQISRRFFNAGGKSFGYGNPLYANGACNLEGSATASCVGNTSGITQGTLGVWWRFLKGNYGTMAAGAQYSYTKRTAFAGAATSPGASATPTTDDNMMLFSFRYMPFQ